MTTDKKQPPDTDRLVLAALRRGGWCHARWLGDAGWSIPGVDDNADWREMPSWDSLAILDRYDEERAKWEAKVRNAEDKCIEARDERDALRSQVTALTEERDLALSSASVENEEVARLISERDAALARADRAEKERDGAVEWCRRVAEALDCIRDDGEIGDSVYVAHHARALRRFAAERDEAAVDELAAIAERNRAIAERDALIVSRDEQFMRANKNAARVDEAIRERDDLGCQLEALRAVQRDDVADLRTRMEAVERWRAECESVPPHDDPYRGPVDERETVNEALYSADNALLRVEDWAAQTALDLDAESAMSYVSPALSKVRTAIDVINGANEREPLNDDEKGGA